MPIFNWFKWHDEKKIEFISKSRHTGILGDYFADKLFDQFIKRFGFSESFTDLLEKQKELILLKVQHALTDDNSIKTFITICELEISKMDEITTNKDDFYEIKGVLEHEMGFSIDIKKVSVSEYYTYFKALKKIRPSNNGK